MVENVQQLLKPGALPDDEAERWLQQQGFDDASAARRRLLDLCPDRSARDHLGPCLPALLFAVAESASPDASLLNFERFVQSVPDRDALYRYLCEYPRAVEILVKLFVGSQFLTEILLRHPEYLSELTQHRRLAEFKTREEFVAACSESLAQKSSLADKLDAVRSFQKWELLRLGACDTFGLMDLKSVTLQLALLADSVVQVCLDTVAESLNLDTSGFAVLAFGKLGGEELNYSSDIDLVFVAEEGAERYWGLGQHLIKALMDATVNGFLYRVDMRLRPWGRSGPLVTNIGAYVDYLRKSGKLWEKQALLKARCIAGNYAIGQELLRRLTPVVFDVAADDVRANVIDMKGRIEAQLEKTGRKWGEVKAGQGSIRDVEFVTQCLQLVYGGEYPAVRSINTLDGLVRLADLDLIQADEYRRLSSGYVFLRTIEHALQLMHNKQMHTLPQERRELDYLARRLDFPGPDEFVAHYDQHCREIRAVYEKYVLRGEDARHEPEPTPERSVQTHLGAAAASYQEQFPAEQLERHLTMLQELDDETIVRVEAVPLSENRWELTVVGYDQLGDLSAICGLLFVFGYDIISGNVFTGTEVAARVETASGERASRRKFVDVFIVRPPLDVVPPAVWSRYASDLSELLTLLRDKKYGEVQGRLAKRLAGALRETPASDSPLLPVTISVDNEADPDATVLHIQAEDTPGFLYELTNSLSLSNTSITRMQIQSAGRQVLDTLHVTDARGRKIDDPRRVRELRAAVVLIKHFTQLLPASPNPEAALLHFRELLEQLFSQPQWVEQLSDLQQPEVLKALAKMLGVSDFLWDDFLKLQHSNLFPVITDLEALQQPKSQQQLASELAAELAEETDRESRRRVLNAFKDREMLRVDLRHILGLQDKFGMFSRELTDIAEVIVESARKMCHDELAARHGTPCSEDGTPSALSVCALGKCGGWELGFASDIELMFIYEHDGRTDGPEPITTLEFYQQLVECFRKSIFARNKAIFEIDLRLRPYGRAGSLAVSLETFEKYFSADGPAWPFERQALVKLRPIAGDREFGERVVAVRDRLIYTGRPFDVASMRAMREKQNRQLVKAGRFNAKLSPGGLVDCEYFVQGLQMTYGHEHPSLRVTNTREALKALQAAGIISEEERIRLRDAYRFLRRVIDGLRMVRGDARDLTVPPVDSEEFEFLARRLGYENRVQMLEKDLETYTEDVRSLSKRLDRLPGKPTGHATERRDVSDPPSPSAEQPQ